MDQVKNNTGKIIIAYWLTGFLSLFTLAAAGASWLRGNVSTSTYTGFITLAVTFVILILINKKHYSSAFYVGLLVGFFQMGIMQNLRWSGVSFALSTMVMIIGVAYAILLLPTRSAALGIMCSAILGFVTGLIDIFGPSSRPFSDVQTDIVFLAFVVVLLIAITALVFRLWKAFDFATKMVISFIAAALVSTFSSQVYIVFFKTDLEGKLNQLSGSNTSITLSVNGYIQGIMVAGIFGITIASILGLIISSVITRQLRHMTEEIDQIVSTGDVNHQIQIETEDEIGQVGHSLQFLMSYIKDKANTATHLSQGDLTEQVKVLTSKDVLGTAFETMIANLHRAISQVIEDAGTLESASGNLEVVADLSGKATAQISQTVQQIAVGTNQEAESIIRTSNAVEQMSRAIDGIARGAANQSQAVTETSNAVTKINQTIEQVVSGIKVVGVNSKNAQESAGQGSTIVQTNLEGMRSIKQKVDLSTQKVEEMGNQTQNIGIILATIKDIASQTNLLALNAAIEAARAGESGKGFAVVADEVRKLAERSRLATQEIDQLIKKIQFTVSEAVEAMSASALEVEMGVAYSNSANEALSTILQSVDKVNQQTLLVTKAAEDMHSAAGNLVRSVELVSKVVEDNTSATKAMTLGSENVVEAIENISSVSEENSAAVEEVSASTEELAAQANEVTDLARSTAAISKSLAHAVSIFKTK